MPLSTVAKIGAGSALKYEDPATPGTYLPLINALEIGEIGEQGDQVETTPILALSREYIAGLDTPPDKQFVFNHTPGDTDYQDFLDIVALRENINMQIDLPTGDTATFNVALLGRMLSSPTGGEQLKMTVYGKQSGQATFTETV